jgi:hypothetical protein
LDLVSTSIWIWFRMNISWRDPLSHILETWPH